jgi:hypothetical protein
MTTRLKKIALDCKALLDASSCTVEHHFDALALDEHQGRRRVVWLSDHGDVRPPGNIGGKLATNGRRVTAAATRDAEVQVFIYGETPEVAEQLCDNVIVAVAQVLENVKWRGYDVIGQQEKQVGHVVRVECYLLKFLLPLPVPNEITPLPTVDYVNTTGDALTVATAVDEQGSFDLEQEDPWPDNGGDEPEDP